MSNKLKARAKLGILLPSATRPRVGGINFIGWRECHRGTDGKYSEKAEHIIQGAPGVDERLGDNHTDQSSLEHTGDLFVKGQPLHLTRNDASTEKPMVIEVAPNPMDPLFILVRRGIADGDLEQVE